MSSSALRERREAVFLVLAGIFLGAMTMLNVLGITRFIRVGPFALAVGVLPYPLTFLCTDLIGELYGRRRASLVVWVGFALNLIVLATLWLAATLPAVDTGSQPPWQVLHLSQPVVLPDGSVVEGQAELFDFLYACASGAVFASLVAYLAAQLCDVYLFHFWKRRTKGRHLWLRNNGSTMVSQLVDSVAVITITFGAAWWRGDMALATMARLIVSSYGFKVLAAAADTIPFYLGVRGLSTWLEIDPLVEHDEETGFGAV